MTVRAARGRRQWYPLAIGVALGALVTGLVLPWAIEPGTSATGIATSGAGAGSGDTAGSGEMTVSSAPTGEGDASSPVRSATDGTSSAPLDDAAKSGGAPATKGSLTASDVGVTPSSIKVGVLVPDLGGIGRLGFSVDGGDVQAQFRAFFDDASARGALHGRKVQPVFQTFDPLSPDSMHSACLALAEDHKVFAALSGGGFYGPPVLCLTRDHRIPLLVSIDSSPEEYYPQSGGLLFTELPNKHRLLRVLVGELDRMDALRGHKIGIVDSDLPADKPAVDGGLVPALAKYGYTVAHRETVSGDPSIAASQMPLAAQQMRTRGIDVLLLPMNPIFSSLFASEADRQGYRPTYFASDFAVGTSDFALTAMPESYDGTLGFTSMRTGEHRTPAPEAEADASCRATYEKATGTSVERGSDPYRSTLGACGLVRLFEAGVQGAGPAVTRSAMSAALRQQRGFAMPNFIETGSFGPAKFDAADFIRTVRADMSCTCWLPASEPRQARF